ncbi:hypothetical protein ACIQZI_20985 [Peribacillus sp. NPDC096379]|uniref:hypothetical protein n=1 Tax=Peribacillus sp. NPDC096379 TaxID=3364393 RepID=UPI0038228A57
MEACTVKKYKATTNSKHLNPVSESFLDRQFKAVDNYDTVITAHDRKKEIHPTLPDGMG